MNQLTLPAKARPPSYCTFIHSSVLSSLLVRSTSSRMLARMVRLWVYELGLCPFLMQHPAVKQFVTVATRELSDR